MHKLFPYYQRLYSIIDCRRLPILYLSMGLKLFLFAFRIKKMNLDIFKLRINI